MALGVVEVAMVVFIAVVVVAAEVKIGLLLVGDGVVVVLVGERVDLLDSRKMDGVLVVVGVVTDVSVVVAVLADLVVEVEILVVVGLDIILVVVEELVR